MKYHHAILVFYGITSLIFTSCDKEKTNPLPATVVDSTTDARIYELAKAADSNVRWYKNSARYLSRGGNSSHEETYLRTRYNAIAAMNLDAAGKVKQDASFAKGSLIVKELVNDTVTGAISTYAIAYKNPNDKNADTNGWVWGYTRADGTVRNAVTRKGGGCVNCHSGQGNIDRMLMNVAHP